MTSPTPPPNQPPKTPEPPSLGQKAQPEKNSFNAMLDKANLNESQRKAFFNSLMQQASNAIKSAFRHMIDTMKSNQRGD